GVVAICDSHVAMTGGTWPACGVLRNDSATFVGGWCGFPPDFDQSTGVSGPCAGYSGNLGGQPATFRARHGSVTLRPDGWFSYTPDPGFTGDDSFGYRTGPGTGCEAADPTAGVFCTYAKSLSVNETRRVYGESYTSPDRQNLIVPVPLIAVSLHVV